MKLFYFTVLMFKRYLKNIAFMSVIIIIPFCCLFLRFVGMGGDIKIKVGLYSESRADIDMLYEYEGAVRFICYEDLEEMKDDVCGRSIECGYYFTEDLPEVYDGDNMKRAIICYKSPATSFNKVVNEIIFSEFFYGYAYDILETFTYPKTNKADREELYGLYNSFLNTDAVISLDYEYIESSAVETETLNAFGFLRGILGIYIMLGGLLGGFCIIKDFKAGFGKTFSPFLKTVVSYAYFITPALLCGLSAFLGLCLGGNGGLAEALNTFLYSLTAACFGALVYCFFDNEKSLTSVLTAVVLASLIFCPIFTDTGSIIKIAAVLEKLLLPTYYINNSLAAPLAVCFGMSFVCMLVKNRD
ncbi:MAG: hypothetical protein LUC97_00060 [Clostridiales bacterium]|nr:hypothetical protein [Clostridiales bacterium]